MITMHLYSTRLSQYFAEQNYVAFTAASLLGICTFRG